MRGRGWYTVRVLTHSRWWCLFFLSIGKKSSWYLGTNFWVGGWYFNMEEESSWYLGTNFWVGGWYFHMEEESSWYQGTL